MKKVLKNILKVILAILLVVIIFDFFWVNLPKFMASNEIKDIKNYSKKVEDLYISENIRVISLGEATHGNADFQSLKFDILKNLV